MRKVKGTMVLMVVKSIKYNKSKKDEYDRMLSDEAKEFLNERILSTEWYPYEPYKECFDTLCFIEGRNNPEILNQWGQVESKRLMTTIYKISVFKGDIQIAIDRYSRFHKRVFNFGEITSKIISDTEITLTYEDFDPSWENFYYIGTGYAQGFIELCLDKKTDYKFLNKSWKGEGWTQVLLSWSL